MGHYDAPFTISYHSEYGVILKEISFERSYLSLTMMTESLAIILDKSKNNEIVMRQWHLGNGNMDASLRMKNKSIGQVCIFAFSDSSLVCVINQ